MKIILSRQCASFTGSVGQGYGYAVRKHRGGFYAFRNSRGSVPPDGHWRFIVACAELAQMKMHIVEIEVNWMELQTALYEAHFWQASEHVGRNYCNKAKATYNARDILNLKTLFGL